MIINGASRSNGRFFSRHLMRADENERVHVVELRGFAYAEDVPGAFRELEDLADGTACKNHFYHANLNTRAEERLTPEQWAQAVDRLERELHLDGQPRLIVEHEKEGRTHRHVVWSRIDQDSRTAISDSHNYRRHELVSRALEAAFGHDPTPPALTRNKTATPRPERTPPDWETFRAKDSGLDPKAITAELTALWRQADTGQAFAAALAERGYILARGDRRDFCVIDAAGDEHSLARRLSGVRAAEVRARLADVDRGALPSVEEGRAMARQRPATAGSGNAPTSMVAAAAFGAALATTVTVAARTAPASRRAERPRAERAPSPSFEDFMARVAREARAEYLRAEARERAAPGSRFGGFRAWLDNLRDHVAGWCDQLYEWIGHYLGQQPRHEPPPSPSLSGPQR